MNRRNFFRRALPSAIAGAGAAAIAAPVVAQALSADLPDEIIRDGIVAHWLGWKTAPTQDVFYGVWIFTLPDGRMSYSTTLGLTQRYYQRADSFNLTRLDRTDPWLDSLNDAPELRRHLRTSAYDRGIADAIAWRDEPPSKPAPFEFVCTGPVLLESDMRRFPNIR